MHKIRPVRDFLVRTAFNGILVVVIALALKIFKFKGGPHTVVIFKDTCKDYNDCWVSRADTSKCCPHCVRYIMILLWISDILRYQ